MAVEEPADRVVLGDFVSIPFAAGDTITLGAGRLDDAPHVDTTVPAGTWEVVSSAPDRRSLVLREKKSKK